MLDANAASSRHEPHTSHPQSPSHRLVTSARTSHHQNDVEDEEMEDVKERLELIIPRAITGSWARMMVALRWTLMRKKRTTMTTTMRWVLDSRLRRRLVPRPSSRFYLSLSIHGLFSPHSNTSADLTISFFSFASPLLYHTPHPPPSSLSHHRQLRLYQHQRLAPSCLATANILPPSSHHRSSLPPFHARCRRHSTTPPKILAVITYLLYLNRTRSQYALVVVPLVAVAGPVLKTSTPRRIASKRS
ncbi:hypothetical protein M422DRAFT_777169 [Sphaerobolus stellatus SS14]|nr:hypothetical protein M422DRAFT_777169 [Sphaerobolus stellatus SS14]